MTNLKAKKLIAHFDNDQYPVYELESGLILVSSDITNDWFFCSQNEIVGNGYDVFEYCEETGETVEFTLYELAQSLAGSTNEFCYDEAIKKGWDLIKSSR